MASAKDLTNLAEQYPDASYFHTPGATYDLTNPTNYTQAIRDNTLNPFNKGKNTQQTIHQLQSQAFNSAEAAKNRDWQEAMSNSAHQREVMDLQQAGLNTWTGIDQGSSTPAGSSGTSSAMQATDFTGPALIHSLTSMAGQVIGLFGHKGSGSAVKTAAKALAGSASSAREASDINSAAESLERAVKAQEPKHQIEQELAWTKNGSKKANKLRDLLSDFGSSFVLSD